MRDIITLLKLLKEEVEDQSLAWDLGKCLCVTISAMGITERDSRPIITADERIVLGKYLKRNKPDNAIEGPYWYKPGERQPRIEYLDKQIEYEIDILKDRRV